MSFTRRKRTSRAPHPFPMDESTETGFSLLEPSPVPQNPSQEVSEFGANCGRIHSRKPAVSLKCRGLGASANATSIQIRRQYECEDWPTVPMRIRPTRSPPMVARMPGQDCLSKVFRKGTENRFKRPDQRQEGPTQRDGASQARRAARSARAAGLLALEPASRSIQGWASKRPQPLTGGAIPAAMSRHTCAIGLVTTGTP